MSVAPGYRTRVDALADFGPLEVHRCAVFCPGRRRSISLSEESTDVAAARRLCETDRSAPCSLPLEGAQRGRKERQDSRSSCQRRALSSARPSRRPGAERHPQSQQVLPRFSL